MSSEDFPALPGTQSREGPSPGGSISGDKSMSVGLGPEISQDVLQANRALGSDKSQTTKKGILTSPDGKGSCSTFPDDAQGKLRFGKMQMYSFESKFHSNVDSLAFEGI